MLSNAGFARLAVLPVILLVFFLMGKCTVEDADPPFCANDTLQYHSTHILEGSITLNGQAVGLNPEARIRAYATDTDWYSLVIYDYSGCKQRNKFVLDLLDYNDTTDFKVTHPRGRSYIKLEQYHLDFLNCHFNELEFRNGYARTRTMGSDSFEVHIDALLTTWGAPCTLYGIDSDSIRLVADFKTYPK